MKSWRKITLLVLSLMVFSQLFAKGDVAAGSSAVHLFAASVKAFPFLSVTQAGSQSTDSPAVTSNFIAEKESSVSKIIVKYKKKYKRTLSCSTRLKQPVKDIDALPTNIFAKETYSKPHFLSHLHYFLFRLTPF